MEYNASRMTLCHAARASRAVVTVLTAAYLKSYGHLFGV
jgi:hypothetical protein